MNTYGQNLGALIGRLCFSLIYLVSSIGKITNFNGTVEYMASRGMTLYVNELAILAIIFELGGALMVIFGFYTRFGALLLFFLTLGTCFEIHNFWTYPAAEATNQMIHFMKNIAMIGGTFYIMSFGAGKFSIDGLRNRGK
jgi:putative oxidoreductase